MNYCTRRISLITVFAFVIAEQSLFASEIIFHAVPCDFNFDASRNKAILDVDFRVDNYRNYIFTLQFHHSGGADGMRVGKIVGTGDEMLFTKESADSEHRVKPDLPDTLDGVTRARDGLRRGIYVYRPTDLSGAIPIHISIEKLEAERPITITDEVIQTLGHFAGGGGHLDREVTVVALSPGLYHLRASTIRDNPRFNGIPIRFGITWQPNTKILD